MKEMASIQDVNSDLQMNNPEIRIDINRDKASALGITANQIENALQNAYSSNQVSTIYAPTDSYQVIMELLPRYQREPSSLSLLYIRSAGGNLVPLDTVATLTSGVGPL